MILPQHLSGIPLRFFFQKFLQNFHLEFLQGILYELLVKNFRMMFSKNTLKIAAEIHSGIIIITYYSLCITAISSGVLFSLKILERLFQYLLQNFTQGTKIAPLISSKACSEGYSKLSSVILHGFKVTFRPDLAGHILIFD